MNAPIAPLSSFNNATIPNKANRFLRNMIRAIGGALIAVGFMRISIDELAEILTYEYKGRMTYETITSPQANHS